MHPHLVNMKEQESVEYSILNEKSKLHSSLQKSGIIKEE